MDDEDFVRPVFFPFLKRKLDGNRIESSIGLSDWSKKIQSEREEGHDEYFNKYCQICLIKGSEDVSYDVKETKREIIISYKWKDFEEDLSLVIDDED